MTAAVFVAEGLRGTFVVGRDQPTQLGRSSATLANDPWRRARRSSSAKQPSTALNHDTLVAVKWRMKRGGRPAVRARRNGGRTAPVWSRSRPPGESAPEPNTDKTRTLMG